MVENFHGGMRRHFWPFLINHDSFKIGLDKFSANPTNQSWSQHNEYILPDDRMVSQCWKCGGVKYSFFKAYFCILAPHSTMKVLHHSTSSEWCQAFLKGFYTNVDPVRPQPPARGCSGWAPRRVHAPMNWHPSFRIHQLKTTHCYK